jgi:hypothetical protein
MTILGTWPSDTYYLSWMTQRLANRAPEWTHARRYSSSVFQQLLNPVAQDIERINKQLIEERNNIFLSSADINLIDRLYYLELGVGMEFTITDPGDGIILYTPPTVYADINGTEYQLTIAENNDVESLCYSALPSRIEYGETTYVYNEVIPRTTVSELGDITPGDINVPGYLYVTLRGNTIWEYIVNNKIFYPKLFIRGTTRKGTELQEAIPLRYNGTFKTINQWKEVTDVFVSYLDDTAEITLEVLPFDRDTQLDTYNLIVPASGIESWRFLRLEEKTWGSTLVSEGFTVSSFDVIRKGYDTLDYEWEMELQDSSSNPITLTAITLKQNTNHIFAIDEDNLYIYDSRLPYPDLTGWTPDSVDTKMDLWSDRWIYARDDSITIHTDIIDVSQVPYKIRWGIKDPDGSEYYLLEDGTRISISSSTNAWIGNTRWETGDWKEQQMDLTALETGVHIVTLESFYADPNNQANNFTYTTKFVYYVPAATPQHTIALPSSLQNSSNIAFDSDGRLWFYDNSNILLSDIYYDYFLADYEKNTVWLRENYSSVRVVI